MAGLDLGRRRSYKATAPRATHWRCDEGEARRQQSTGLSCTTCHTAFDCRPRVAAPDSTQMSSRPVPLTAPAVVRKQRAAGELDDSRPENLTPSGSDGGSGLDLGRRRSYKATAPRATHWCRDEGEARRQQSTGLSCTTCRTAFRCRPRVAAPDRT